MRKGARVERLLASVFFASSLLEAACSDGAQSGSHGVRNECHRYTLELTLKGKNSREMSGQTPCSTGAMLNSQW